MTCGRPIRVKVRVKVRVRVRVRVTSRRRDLHLFCILNISAVIWAYDNGSSKG